MRLTDFDILVESGFSETNRAINARTRTVVYAFRFELGSRSTVEAPFGKLLIQLVESHADLPSATARQLLDVMTVWLHVDEKDLFDEPARRNAILLDLTERALDRVSEDCDWSDPELYDIVRTLRARDRLGWIDLGFEKRDRGTGRIARVFLVVNDEWWAVWVVVVSPEGEEVRRERVAYSEHEALVDTAFPVRSIVVKDGAFVLRDRDRRTLATVSLRDQESSPMKEGVDGSRP